MYLNFGLANTLYSPGIAGGGYPNDFILGLEVLDASGAVLHTDANLGGFSSNAYNYVVQGGISPTDVSTWTSGQTQITVTFNVDSIDGLCSIVETEVFTVGCKDALADNYSSAFDLEDNSQCTYTGCTDGTLKTDGTVWATNYIAGAVACNAGTANENDCCVYPMSNLNAEFNPQLYSSPSDFSSLEELEFSFYGTGFTKATISQFSVTTPGGAGWVGANIGGSLSGTPWVNSLGADNDLTLSNTYSSGLAFATSVPSTFDNNDTAWVPSGGSTNALAHGPLTITYAVEWEAVIVNASKNNLLAVTDFYTQTFTGGCKVGGSTYSNYDPNLHMHIPGSCTLIQILGCTDSTAINYNSSANTDDGSCCVGCSDVSTLSLSDAGTASMKLHFTEVCEATLYSVELNISNGGWVPSYAAILSTDPGLVNGNYTLALNPNLALQTEVQVRIKTTCSDNSISSYSNTASTVIS